VSTVSDTSPAATGTPPRSRWRYPVTAIPVVGLAAAAALASGGHGSHARWLLIALSTVLAAGSAIPSIRAVIADPASLQPVTWGIWALLTGLAAGASAVSGDWPSAIFSAVGTITCATVTVVVVRVGDHTFTRIDATCLTLGTAGLIGWQTLHQPPLAVLAACAGDLAALTPTIVHAWQRPHEEPTASFALIAAGGLLAAAAAWGDWTITALAYPIYVAASTGLVALLTLRRPPDPAVDAPTDSLDDPS
jgi:hypothetical protein